MKHNVANNGLDGAGNTEAKSITNQKPQMATDSNEDGEKKMEENIDVDKDHDGEQLETIHHHRQHHNSSRHCCCYYFLFITILSCLAAGILLFVKFVFL
mmetsp:Transcript_38509/g.56606  ORF Transcript_38509/g.56606 Transcript_38509/m.56606 type:complete len:99 (+) Transcript_38509:25-321(+)